MSLFSYKCVWGEIERFYASPVKEEFSLQGSPSETLQMMKQMSLGVTTIHFVCECGEHKFVEILGKTV